MTTALSSYLPNLYDLKKSLGASSEELQIVELLKQACPMIEDMGWKEGNTNTGHIIRSRTALPAPSWVGVGEGVTPSFIILFDDCVIPSVGMFCCLL